MEDQGCIFYNMKSKLLTVKYVSFFVWKCEKCAKKNPPEVVHNPLQTILHVFNVID